MAKYKYITDIRYIFIFRHKGTYLGGFQDLKTFFRKKQRLSILVVFRVEKFTIMDGQREKTGLTARKTGTRKNRSVSAGTDRKKRPDYPDMRFRLNRGSGCPSLFTI